MTVTVESLGIDKLSVGERLDLIDQIWDSIPDGIEVSEVPVEHLPELEVCRRQADREPGAGLPWREAMEQIPFELSADSKERLQRRMDELKADPSIAVTWDQIQRNVRTGWKNEGGHLS